MSRLSIVIAAWGSRAELEATLVSVLENRPEACEVIVALNEPYADPYDLRDEVRFLELPAKTGLVDAWNETLTLCRGPFVHFLACGATVDRDWVTHALSAFEDRRVAAVVPTIVQGTDQGQAAVSGWRFSRGGACRPLALPAAEAREAVWEGATLVAAFYRRAALRSLGPVFDASLGADIASLDLCLRLAQAGHQVSLQPNSRVATDRALREPPARPTERLFWRYAACRGWLGSAIAHAALVTGEFCRTLPRPRALTVAIGRIVGACQHRARDTVRYRIEPLESDATVERRLDPPHIEATAPVGERISRLTCPGIGPRKSKK